MKKVCVNLSLDDAVFNLFFLTMSFDQFKTYTECLKKIIVSIKSKNTYEFNTL